MSFRVERILTNGRPDLFFPRKNKDATPGDTVSAFDPNQLSEAVVDTQTLLLSTIDDVTALQASLGQTTLQDVYDNSAAAGLATIIVQPGKPLEIANALKVDSNQTTTATGTLYVNFSNQLLKLIYNEMSTSVTDLLVKAGGGNDLLLEATKDLLLKDSNLQLLFSDSSNSSLETTAQTIVGALNELHNTVVAAGLQDIYNIASSITTGGNGPINLINGTGNPTSPVIVSTGIIYSETFDGENLSIGTASIDSSGHFVTAGNITGVNVFAQEINAGVNPLVLTDTYISAPLTDASNTSLDTANQTIIGSINELKADILSAGLGNTDLYLSHEIGGYHKSVHVNVPLGDEALNVIDIKDDSSTTNFSVDGNGIAKLQGLETIGGADLLQQITDAFNHITEDGLSHSDLFNHVNDSNPHNTIKSVQVVGDPAVIGGGNLKLDFGTGFTTTVDDGTKTISISSDHFAAANPHNTVKSLGVIGEVDTLSGDVALELGPGLTGSVNLAQQRINLDIADEYGPITILENGDDFPSSTVKGSLLIRGTVNLNNYGVVWGDIHFESGGAKIVGNNGMTIYGDVIGIINGANQIDTSGSNSGEAGGDVTIYGSVKNTTIITSGASLLVAVGGDGGNVNIGSINGGAIAANGGGATSGAGGSSGTVSIKSSSSVTSINTEGGHGNGTSDGGQGGNVICGDSLVANIIKTNGGNAAGASGDGGKAGEFSCDGPLTVNDLLVMRGGTSSGGTGGATANALVKSGCHIKTAEIYGYSGNAGLELNGICVIDEIINSTNYSMVQAGDHLDAVLYIKSWSGSSKLTSNRRHNEALGNVPATPTAADVFDLSRSTVLGDFFIAYASGVVIASQYVTFSDNTGPGGVDQIIIDSVAAGIPGGTAISIDYAFHTGTVAGFDTRFFRYTNLANEWRVYNDGGAA